MWKNLPAQVVLETGTLSLCPHIPDSTPRPPSVAADPEATISILVGYCSQQSDEIVSLCHKGVQVSYLIFNTRSTAKGHNLVETWFVKSNAKLESLFMIHNTSYFMLERNWGNEVKWTVKTCIRNEEVRAVVKHVKYIVANSGLNRENLR